MEVRPRPGGCGHQDPGSPRAGRGMSAGGRRLADMQTRIGAHVDSADPVAAAKACGAEVIQFFLSDPQSYAAPTPHPHADAIRASGLEVYIHSPYRLNVATTNNRIRVPSRKLLAQHARAAAEIGAKGLVVHAGHVDRGADLT